MHPFLNYYLIFDSETNYDVSHTKKSDFLGINWGYLFGSRKHNTNLVKAKSDVSTDDKPKKSFWEELFGSSDEETASGNTRTLQGGE